MFAAGLDILRLWNLDIFPSAEIGHGLRRRPMFIEEKGIDCALHRRAMFKFSPW
jgi:hypothetical protein